MRICWFINNGKRTERPASPTHLLSCADSRPYLPSLFHSYSHYNISTRNRVHRKNLFVINNSNQQPTRSESLIHNQQATNQHLNKIEYINNSKPRSVINRRWLRLYTVLPLCGWNLHEAIEERRVHNPSSSSSYSHRYRPWRTSSSVILKKKYFFLSSARRILSLLARLPPPPSPLAVIECSISSSSSSSSSSRTITIR